jgi:hypothetical protein
MGHFHIERPVQNTTVFQEREYSSRERACDRKPGEPAASQDATSAALAPKNRTLIAIRTDLSVQPTLDPKRYQRADANPLRLVALEVGALNVIREPSRIDRLTRAGV